MSKTAKKVLVVVALLTIVIVAFSACSIDDVYNTNIYEIDESFDNIEVKTDTADIEFVLSNEEKCKVSCDEKANLEYDVKISENTLMITLEDTRKWYQKIGFSFKASKLIVYLPKTEYSSLLIEEKTGDIKIPKDFRFESIDATVSTGNVSNSASAKDLIKISATTGNVCIENLISKSINLTTTTGNITASDVKSDGEIKIKVSTGKTILSNVSCDKITSYGSTGDISLSNVATTDKLFIERSTGDLKLDGCNANEFYFETDTGDVKLEMCDAKEIFIETDTGDVTGTLLTSKVFLINTDTGRVNVPKTTVGGKCEITTDTGDIKISLAEN